MNEISDLVQYGAVGICFLLIAFMAYVWKGAYKIITNHLAHSSVATSKLVETLTELKDKIAGCPSNKNAK